MLFVTNRTPANNNAHFVGEKITFDLQNTLASETVYFCTRKAPFDYINIGSQRFIDKLNELPQNTQILFYLHGFNDTDEARIFPHADLLQALINHQAKQYLVHVIPLIWPCDDDSLWQLADDYWEDQTAADNSGIAFANFFHQMKKVFFTLNDTVNKPRKCQLFTHSMGARVLTSTLAEMALTFGEDSFIQYFSHVFMAAPDLVNNALECEKEGEKIPKIANNIIIYHARDDLALGASQIANLRHRVLSRRLGRTGVKSLNKVPDNIYQVDCNDFNHQFEPGVGHVYFLTDPWNRTSPIVKHVVNTIIAQQVIPNIQQHALAKPQKANIK